MAEEQNQTKDINSRLKARLKPSVPPRKTSLLRRSTDEQESVELQHQPSEEAVSKSAESKQGRESETSPKLVSFTLRVEEVVGKKLKYLCSVENITKETFLEAAYLVCAENEQMMQQVLGVAKARRQQRREAGIKRRAQAMSKYLPETRSDPPHL